MRTYYAFKINNYFAYVYRNKPYKLYKMLEEMYYTKEYDVIATYKSYKQMASEFYTLSFNEYICNSFYGNYNYERQSNAHLYKDGFEVSKLIVGSSNLKIVSNLNYPIFFNIINDYIDDVFICDFKEKDYFWLDKVIINDGQKEDNLVKL